MVDGNENEASSDAISDELGQTFRRGCSDRWVVVGEYKQLAHAFGVPAPGSDARRRHATELPTSYQTDQPGGVFVGCLSTRAERGDQLIGCSSCLTEFAT